MFFFNKEEKIKKIMKTHNVSEREAAKLMKVTDKRRSINYNYYTDGQWGKEKVAIDLNISREALSHYENGKREPSLDMLIKMSEYFNVSIVIL